MAPLRTLAAGAVILALLFARHDSFLLRVGRNLFTPAVPRPVEPRYPLVEATKLAADVTVVVGTKDTITPTLAQLEHLRDALPPLVRVIYTYPQPLWDSAEEYQRKLRHAAGPLAARLTLLAVDPFINPFEAWLQAIPLVETKYTLLMHNDVFLLDSHFLSELHGALEAHESHAVAAPQIYETELKGLLTTHLFNTNLHLRLNDAGVAIMSHEVDLTVGLAREPSDFREAINRNFLEDHVFLARTAVVNADLIDPSAAFTLEYVDLQLNLIKQNLSQLYVPSARAEFRLWDFGWQDVPYFVRRRSEEQARQTKRHLEAKWGVEFPNTGFCNFVKFSIIRHLELDWTQLPSRWVEQAALVASWFETIGFNRHANLTLGQLLPALRDESEARASSSDSPRSEGLLTPHGLVVSAFRTLVSTSKVSASDWADSGIGKLLPFQPKAVRLETRYEVEHMSLAVLRVPLTSRFDRERVTPLCGLLMRSQQQDVCWIYVAPHRFDHPLFQAIEWLLVRVRAGPRVALALAMKLTNAELSPGAHDSQVRKLAAAGVRVVMCGEHHWRCEAEYDFPRDGRLLAWSGRMNSWPKVVRTLLPEAEELHSLYAAMALLVCLGAAATAYSATQAKTAVAVLALDWLLVVLGVQVAHAAVLAHASRTAVLGVWWRGLLFLLWLAALAAVNRSAASRYEVLLLATAVVALCTARRVYLALLTLGANHKPSLLLPLLSRLIGTLNSSPLKLKQHEDAICKLDLPTPAVAIKRQAALAALRRRYVFSWPRSNELIAFLCGAQAEAMPLDFTPVPCSAARRKGSDECTPPTEAEAESGTGEGADAPTHTNQPMESSTTSARRGGVADGEEAAVSETLVALLRQISGKEDIHFHLCGSSALLAAARLARVNTGKPLLVTFGGGAHGWSDGVAAESLSLGEERYACDVLTLRERSVATLRVLRLRRDEIAAVLVNPLQGVATAEGGGCGGYNSYHAWLAELRETCSRCGLPLIFDEIATGFRLSRGGAQSYFGVQADVVCYGKSGTGGLPLGVLCGPKWLLTPSAPYLPLRAGAESSSGGVAQYPSLLREALAFLRWLDAPPQRDIHERQAEAVAQWVRSTNEGLRAALLPFSLRCEHCVWCLRFEKAGRYHWLLQLLVRDLGGQLAWIAPGKLSFPLQTTAAELNELSSALLRAASQMRKDSWWTEAAEVKLQSETHIRWQLAREVVQSTYFRLRVAAFSLLPSSRG